MKPLILVVLIALATLAPIILVGSSYKDKRIGNSLYAKGLQYDRTQEIVSKSDIKWKVNCAENCRIEVNITPKPDNGSVSIEVSFPGGVSASAMAWAGMGERWAVEFPKKTEGWHDINLDYTYEGVPVNLVKSFYIN